MKPASKTCVVRLSFAHDTAIRVVFSNCFPSFALNTLCMFVCFLSAFWTLFFKCQIFYLLVALLLVSGKHTTMTRWSKWRRIANKYNRIKCRARERNVKSRCTYHVSTCVSQFSINGLKRSEWRRHKRWYLNFKCHYMDALWRVHGLIVN